VTLAARDEVTAIEENATAVPASEFSDVDFDELGSR
jgi:hypothetical protein